MNIESSQLLTSNQLAECLCVAPKTIGQWRRDGLITATLRLRDGTYRYDFAQVVEQLSAQR